MLTKRTPGESPAMPPDPYDRGSRFLLHHNKRVLTLWLLGQTQETAKFNQWLDTRTIPWPGQPERICDTVAWMWNLLTNFPWAILYEFQTNPDPTMLGRLLIYLGSLWLEKQPGDNPEDRFFVGAVVVNLRGKSQAMPAMTWETAGISTTVQVRPWDLAETDAVKILDGVEAGSVPRAVLAWVPCMKGGNNPDLIPRWRTLADVETNPRKKSELGLALLFAEAAECHEEWTEGLKGWNVIQSKLVQQWQAEGKAEGKIEGRAEGRTKGKMEMLLRLLRKKFGQLPEEVSGLIESTTDSDRLDSWAEIAGLAISFEQFRTDARL